MTEKIRLKDGTEFIITPMGITDKNKLRYFKVVSDLPHDDVLVKFSDDINIAKIEHVLADGTIGVTYQDCVAFKSLAFVPGAQIDDNTVSDIYVVVLSTDALERGLKLLNNEIDNIVNTIIMMSMT